MRYIRFFLSALLVFCVSGLPVWGKLPEFPELNREIEQQVTQVQTKGKKTPAKGNAKAKAKAARPAAKRNSAKLTDRQKIVEALDKVRLKWGDPNMLDWVQRLVNFEAENKAFTLHFQYRVDLLYKLVNRQLNILNGAIAKEKKQGKNSLQAAIDRTYTVEQKCPNYGEETAGIKFIYVTDASGHRTQSIVSEVKSLIQAVRDANPNKKILLATEFARMTKFATPIKFADRRNDSMSISDPYDQLITQAKNLDIDILALDDTIVFQWGHVTEYKKGNRLLQIPLPIEEVIVEETWEQIFGFVNASPLGMKLRNEQWASYIRAVESFYDIVIVYGGDGHIDSKTLPEFDVPMLLGGEYIIFNFYTFEQNKKEDEFLIKTHKMLCDNNACVQEPQDPQEEYAPIWQTEQSAENSIEWDGKSYIYEKMDYQKFEQEVDPLLPAEVRAEYDAAFNAFLDNGFKNIVPKRQFDVYLPYLTPYVDPYEEP